MNTYGYVGGNPLSFSDLYGLTPYYVSRGTDVNIGSHNFTASYADYVGDPNAEIGSIGRTSNGMLGKVDYLTTGMSDTTSQSDEDYWADLAKDSCRFSSPTAKIIPADDWDVHYLINSLIENNQYWPILGTNSNTGIQAVVNTASGQNISSPNPWWRPSPSTGTWKKIKFYK